MAPLETDTFSERDGRELVYLRRSSRFPDYVKGFAVGFSGQSAPPSYVLPSGSENFDGSGAGHPGVHSGVAGEGLCGGSSFSSSPPFFANVFGSKGRFREETHIRTLPPHQVAKEGPFQDGGPLEDCKDHLQRPVGRKAGPQRCLYECPPFPPSKKVLWFRPWEENFLFQGAPLRPINSPLGLHKAHEGHQEVFEETRSEDYIFPRRLSNIGEFVPGSSGSHCQSYQALTEVGVRDKLGQVLSSSSKSVGVSRGDNRSREYDFLSAGGKNSKTEVSDKVYREIFSPKVRAGYSGGVFKFCSRFSPIRSSPAETHSEVGQSKLVSPSKAPMDPLRRGVKRSSPTLGVGGFSEGKVSNSPEDSLFDPDDRRLRGGLERGSSPLNSFGPLGSFPIIRTHQLERIEGSSAHDSSLPTPVKGKMCKSKNRQHDSNLLCEAAGLSEIGQTLVPLQRDPGAVLGAGYFPDPKTHKRSLERPCGQGLEIFTYRDRMVPGQGFIPGDMQVGGSFAHLRLICNLRELPLRDLRLSLPGFRSMDRGRFLRGLEHLGDYLRFSSTSGIRQSGDEIASLQGERVCHSPLLAIQAMVHPSSGEVPREIPPARRLVPEPVFQHRDNRPDRSFRFSLSRLDLIEDSLQDEGLSHLAQNCFLACHQQSTIDVYQGVWVKFVNFLDLEGISRRDVKLCHVLNFLAFELEMRNLAYSTIAGYKCALQLPLLIHLGLDVNVERSKRFLEGCYNLTPPSGGNRMPTWELDDLLIFLCSDRFEPMNRVPFKNVTRKVLALLLIASGRRISEIAAISRLSSWRNGRLSLQWLPNFRAKMDSAAWQPNPPSILKAVGEGEQINLLCPVRAYNEYLLRRNGMTNQVDDQFFWMNKQASLANAFRCLIKESRRFRGKSVNIVMFPHQCKKLAVSYSILYFEAQKHELPPLTGNKGMGVLMKIYDHAVVRLNMPVVVPLGTVDPVAMNPVLDG